MGLDKARVLDYLERKAWYALWLALAKESEISFDVREYTLSQPLAPDWLKKFIYDQECWRLSSKSGDFGNGTLAS